jgi:WD40 repeat protein
VFSPEASAVKRANLLKLPHWLERLPLVEDEWTSLIQTLAGHSGSVYAVAFSPDGKRIVSGSYDNTVKLWDATTGEVQKTMAGHSRSVITIDFSSDGKRIASGSWNGTVKLWDAATSEVQKTMAGHSRSVKAIAFSPDGKRIASGSMDKTVKLWDAATGEVQKTMAGHSDWVSAIAFSPDGKRIASGSWDNVKLWDVVKSLKASSFLGKALGSHLKFRTCQDLGVQGNVSFLRFSNDSRYLIINAGAIDIATTLDRKDLVSAQLNGLWVGNQWIYYGTLPVLRIPAEFIPSCFDVRGNQVAIGYKSGQALVIDLDCRKLDVILEQSEQQV